MTLALAPDTFLERQRHTLELMHRKLDEEDRAGARELATPIDERGDDTTPSQHPADVAADLERRELVLTLSLLDRRDLEAVDSALARLDAGTYGRCADCGEPIPRERLEVRPHAARDVECERRHTRQLSARRTPI